MFIVFDDADPALKWPKKLLSLPLLNTRGKDCTAATRIYVTPGKQKAVTEAVVEAMRAVRVGDPFDDSVTMGPLISKVQLERVQGFIQRARATKRVRACAVVGRLPNGPDAVITSNPR